MLIRRFEQHQRKADLAVQVALALQHRVLRREHAGDELLRCRLADAARDADHLEPRPRGAALSCQLLQRRQSIGQNVLHDGRIDRAFDNCARRPAPRCLGHELVAVHALALERDEEIAATGFAGINDGMTKSRGGISAVKDLPRPERLEDFSGCDH